MKWLVAIAVGFVVGRITAAKPLRCGCGHDRICSHHASSLMLRRVQKNPEIEVELPASFVN